MSKPLDQLRGGVCYHGDIADEETGDEGRWQDLLSGLLTGRAAKLVAIAEAIVFTASGSDQGSPGLESTLRDHPSAASAREPLAWLIFTVIRGIEPGRGRLARRQRSTVALDPDSTR